MNTLGADVVVAAVDQRHGVREAWQLGDAVLSNDQLLQFRQTQKRVVIDGLDLVGSQVDPLQLAWKVTKDHQKVMVPFESNNHSSLKILPGYILCKRRSILIKAKSDLLILVILL